MTAQGFTIEQPKTRNKSHVSATTAFTAVLSVLSMTAPVSAFSEQLNRPSVVRPSVIGSRSYFAECLVSDLERDFQTKTSMLKRLDYLKSSLKPNWNGEDDLPIEEESYQNAKAALNSMTGRMLKHWNLFPDTNGTLLLSPNDDSVAGISIGNNEFSYAVFVSEDKQLSGKEPFSVDAFKAVIGQTHRLLGYV